MKTSGKTWATFDFDAPARKAKRDPLHSGPNDDASVLRKMEDECRRELEQREHRAGIEAWREQRRRAEKFGEEQAQLRLVRQQTEQLAKKIAKLEATFAAQAEIDRKWNAEAARLHKLGLNGGGSNH
jgi:hypothetical protein